jgi:hypothetical protein
MDLEARVTDSRVSANDESADSVQPSKAVSKKRRSMDPHFVCDSTTRPPPFEVQGKQKAGYSNEERSQDWLRYRDKD